MFIILLRIAGGKVRGKDRQQQVLAVDITGRKFRNGSGKIKYGLEEMPSFGGNVTGLQWLAIMIPTIVIVGESGGRHTIVNQQSR